MLHSFGARRIETVADGNAALEKSQNELIDLLICDCNLPGFDGFDLVRHIRNKDNNPNRYTPVIVLTSHTQVQNVERARDCGAHTVLAKPISPKLLYDRLVWIAEDPRPFVMGIDYIGPDRRFRADDRRDGVDRRAKNMTAADTAANAALAKSA